MADNTTFTPGSGATLALDDIGGVLHQRVKIEVGADGSAADVSDANPVPVSNAGITTIAGAVAGTEMQVDVVGSLPAGTNIIGGAYDVGPAGTTSWGVSGAPVNSADMTTAAAVTDAPTSGQKLVLWDVTVSADTAMNVLFEEETSGADIIKFFIPANGTVQWTPRRPRKMATADRKLTCKASVAGNISVCVSFTSEA